MRDTSPPAAPRIRLRADEVVSQSLDGRTILLDLRTSLYLEVNEAGTVLLPLLEVGAATDELAQALVTRWGVHLDRARIDAAAFVTLLQGRGLLAEGRPAP